MKKFCSETLVKGCLATLLATMTFATPAQAASDTLTCKFRDYLRETFTCGVAPNQCPFVYELRVTKTCDLATAEYQPCPAGTVSTRPADQRDCSDFPNPGNGGSYIAAVYETMEGCAHALRNNLGFPEVEPSPACVNVDFSNSFACRPVDPNAPEPEVEVEVLVNPPVIVVTEEEAHELLEPTVNMSRPPTR